MAGRKKEDTKNIDWLQIEADYCIGMLSLREIVAKHPGTNTMMISRRRNAEGWERQTYRERIKARAEDIVSRRSVTEEAENVTDVTKELMIEVAAKNQADLILQHRKLIPRFKKMVEDLLDELEIQTKNPVLFEELGEILEKPDDRGVDKLNAMYQKVISTPGRVGSLKQLAETLKILINLERQAFGLSDNGNGDADTPPKPQDIPMDDAARRIAFLFAAATKKGK